MGTKVLKYEMLNCKGKKSYIYKDEPYIIITKENTKRLKDYTSWGISNQKRKNISQIIKTFLTWFKLSKESENNDKSQLKIKTSKNINSTNN